MGSTEARTSPIVLRRSVNSDRTLVLSVICLVDVTVIFLWMTGYIGVVDAVSAHVLFVAFTMSLLYMNWSQYRLTIASSAVMLVLFGPLGGPVLIVARLASILLGPLVLQPQASVVKSGHIGRAEEIYDCIRQGRRHNPVEGGLGRFEALFADGETDMQYAAIGAITRQYSPKMRPSLEAALRSSKPALRVQAAAVFAKLRSSYSERATEVLLSLRDNPRGVMAAKQAKEAMDVAASGFVEDDLKQQLLSVARLLEGRALISGTARRDVDENQPRRDTTDPARAQIKRYSCGGMG